MLWPLKMTVKNIILHTCHLIIILNFTHTYVLFAANLDDFRSIAKKFVPNKLAEELTNIAAHSNKFKQQIKSKPDAQSDVYSEYSDENETVRKSLKKIETTPKTRFVIKDQVKNIDFDELVNRVREQLEKSFIKPTTANKFYYKNNEESAESVKHQKQESKNIVAKTTTENAQYDNDETKANDGFKEDDLTKTKDSYEDYVTPSRDKKFESTETKASEKPPEIQTRYKERQEVNQNPYLTEDQDLDEHKSEEVKALTGSILEDLDKTGKAKKLKGTMIPTREYFKMSSPTYFAVSAVAERYDFDEPLPENDREPEDLKHFVNPPASINKKIRLTETD